MTTIEQTTPLTRDQAAAAGRRGLLAVSAGWGPIVGLAAILTVARLAYLAAFCPYDLIEDEAHYWEWSRRLDWSYYTKGPGIALAIRAFTEILGASELAVRLPAVLAAGAATALVGLLAADCASRFGRPDWRAGLFAAGAFALAPINQLLALVSTIDGPLLACWAAACWAAWRALERRSRWAWPVLGAAIGVGFLFKYTILLLPPGLILYVMLRRWAGGRPALADPWRPWAGLAIILATLGLAPVWIWNAAHDWATVRHLLGHLGVAGGDTSAADRWTPAWVVEFLAMQLGLVGPALGLAAVAGAWGVAAWLDAARRPRPSAPAIGDDEDDAPGRPAGAMYLLCCAAPILIFYTAVSLITESEGNWAAGAYVSLLALAGWGAAEGMREYRAKLAVWRGFPHRARPWSGYLRRRPETVGQILWHAALVYGIIAGLGMLRVDLVRDGLARIDAAAASLGRPTSLASKVPVGRFIGARQMGEHAADVLADLRQRTGLEPFVVARHYGRASLLAFYLPGHPSVACASSRLGGRPTQHDFWPDTDLSHPALIGRPALLVGHDEKAWAAAFETVTAIGQLQGDGKRGTRPAYIGINYRGFPAISPPGPPTSPSHTSSASTSTDSSPPELRP